PTRAEMLEGISGFWARLSVNLRFALTRTKRPWTTDDILAMISWILMSNVAFFLLASTTFVSLVLFVINSLQFQEFAANQIAKLISRAIGSSVTIGASVVPDWSSGHITLKNVIWNNPSNGHGQHQQHHQQHHQQQQQQSTDQSMDNEYQEQTEYDMNFSFCDLTFDQIDVQLDFWRWLDGRGPIKSVNVRGVRGVIDQRHMPPYPPDYDAASDRLTRIPGHFEMDNVQLEDMMVTWLQYNFRPVPVSIFAMNLPRLRQQFMMLDVMSADNIAGTFDNCLFSLHKAQQSSFPQTELRFSTAENRAVVSEKTPVKRFKIRLDGLPVDHMSSGASGPLSWLTAGTIDMQATIEIPLEEERPLLQEIIQDLTDLTDSIEFTVLADRIQEFVQQQQQQARPRRPVSTDIKIDLDLQFRNLKASVPLANDDLSYWNNAIVRPVVAFMNANRTFMPIKCSANLPLSNFNGAWGVGDSEIKPILENATSEEFVRLTRDHRVRSRRMKRVGLWGLQ
ncbi:mitochondrial distribution and morphology protein family 31/32, partial [Ramicandelaber brevisporus]